MKSFMREDVSEAEVSSKMSALEQKIDRFLVIFNGCWRDSSPNGLVHHCHVGCACGGMRQDELALVASELYIEVMLCGRPSVPALSRWLKCAKTAKWFLPLVRLVYCLF